MNVTLLMQFLSYFSAFIPVIALIIYWYKKKYNFDQKTNLIGIYLLFYFVIQFLMLILSLNGINNIFLIRIFVVVETFIFSYFVLSLQMKSKKNSLLSAILLTIVIVAVDLIWGDMNSWPVESSMVQGVVITILGMSAIPTIKIKKDYESAFFYFTFAILFSSVNTLLGVGFIELAPNLSFNIQAIVSITSHLIYTWGFYTIIKSKPEIEKNNVKELTPS